MMIPPISLSDALLNRVEIERSCIHATGNEATDVKLELEEPKCHNFCIDNFISMDMDSNLKFYGLDDFHSQAGCSLRCNNGGLQSFTSQQGEDELNLGALDGILDEIDVAEGDIAAQSLAVACKDYLIDLDFTDEISSLNHHRHDKTQIGNSSSDSHSSECSGSSDGAVALSESLAGTDREHNGEDGICEETLSCRVSIDCRKQSGHAQHGEVNNRLLSSNIGKPNYLWNMTTTSINDPSYGRNCSAEARVDNADLGPKRQRKPTKRYIEESTETKPSRCVYIQSRKTTAPLEGR
ncbi:hypothetical protein MLD38_032531 [Melastoma candidum]|uniref:Uncharacterized protein n=1 Tax=Melastoma candidum TaxID=119954 RepID=A0ACB9M4H9_9MYRT|nr:hypothetical protein MLD38_032531 [Melastoma candidum]